MITGLLKIAMPELAGEGDDRGSHGPVFLGALRPGHAVFAIEPQREAHF